jgi:hypothetical protein
MRRTLNIGIAVGTAAIVGTMAAGVASAATGGHQQAAGSAAAVSSVNRHITRTQARQIAMAKVPHSRSSRSTPTTGTTARSGKSSSPPRAAGW